ncbi:MAG: hypothetical protein U0136_15740 [Bdellovibrionota bacterium]
MRKLRFCRKPLILFIAALCSLVGHVASAQAESDAYVRLTKTTGGEPKALETAVVTLGGGTGELKGVTVDLIAAVHIGEKEYFQKLNKAFTGYDAVLYELIAPDNIEIGKRVKENKSIVSSFQGAIQELLALEFQLDQIDYSAKNLVHADLSPDAFMDSMERRGDSVWTLAGRVLLQGMLQDQKEENPVEEMKFIMALLNTEDANRPYKLRRYLALNMTKMDDLIAQLEGSSGSALIADRNAKAVSVFREQLKTKKKHFAIYYGGAHMPDIARRLSAELGLKPVKTSWLTAWTLQPPASGK